MRRIGILASIIGSGLMTPSYWSPPEYHWHSHPSAPGGKSTNAAVIKRQSKKRRNRK